MSSRRDCAAAGARAADAHRLELGHLRRQVAEREPDVVDARALTAPRRRLRDEDDLHAVAVRGVTAVGERLVAQVLGVPRNPL